MGCSSNREPTNLDALLHAMRGRHSSNPIDKVCAIAFPFQQRRSLNCDDVSLPRYDLDTGPSVAWERLITSMPRPRWKLMICSSIVLVGMAESDTNSTTPQQSNYFVCFPTPQDTTGSRVRPKYSNTVMFLFEVMVQFRSQETWTTLHT